MTERGLWVAITFIVGVLLLVIIGLLHEPIYGGGQMVRMKLTGQRGQILDRHVTFSEVRYRVRFVRGENTELLWVNECEVVAGNDNGADK